MNNITYITHEGNKYQVNYFIHRYIEGNKEKIEHEIRKGRILVRGKSIEEAINKLIKEL